MWAVIGVEESCTGRLVVFGKSPSKPSSSSFLLAGDRILAQPLMSFVTMGRFLSPGDQMR
jgi:hypothetical protein